MSKSILYASNSVAQSFTTVGTVINFGSIVRRYGCNLNVSGGNVVVSGCGYYNVTANINFEGAAGTAIIQVYKDGVAIPGAIATVTTAAATEYSISIPCIIREKCNCESTITVMVSGVDGTISNAAIVVVKE